MSVPRAVREAGKRAEEALKKTQVAPGGIPGDAGAKPAADDAGGKPATPAAKPEPTVASLQAQLDELNSKYSTLQGKYNAEIKPQREMEEQNAGLRTQVQTLQTQLQTAQGEIETLKTKQPANEHLEKLRSERGADDDLIMALSEQQKTIDAQAKTIEKLEAKLSGVQTDLTDTKADETQRTKTAYYKYLDDNIPNLDARNKESGWLKWLGQVDQFSGRRRQDLLDEAHAEMDGPRVKSFFDAYEVYKASNKEPSLDDNIADLADGGGSGGHVEVPKKKWKASEIRDFYTKRARKQISDEEYHKTDAEIKLAQKEGRILLGQ